MKNLVKNQNGSAFILIFIILVLTSVIGFSFLSSSQTRLRIAGNSSKESDAWNAVVSGINKSALTIYNMASNANNIDFVAPPGDSRHEDDMGNLFNSLAGAINTLDNEKYNVEITQLRYDPDGTNKSLANDFKIPTTYLGNKIFEDFNAEKRTYKVIVRASSNSGITSSGEGTIAIYSAPIFQFNRLFEGCITSMPGGSVITRGRVHSNTCIRTGTTGGPFTYSPFVNSIDVGKNLTSAGGIWHIFQLIDHNGTYNMSGDVREEVSRNTYASFDDNYISAKPSDIDSSCGDMNSPSHCWKDVDASGYTIYAMEVDSNNPAFRNKITSHTEKLYPDPYKKLLDNYPTEEPSEVLQKVIEPPNASDASDPVLMNAKYGYKADITISIGDDGIPRSIDSTGNLYDSGSPYSYDTLKGLGIFTQEPRSFYLAPAGRNANVIKIDVGRLKAAVENDPSAYDSINHIYVSYSQRTTGELHFPSPDCNSTYSNSGVNPVCVRADGTDCIGTGGTGGGGKGKGKGGGGSSGGCDPLMTGSINTVILTNGAEIPPKGLTVSSANPVFVEGDYNSKVNGNDVDDVNVKPRPTAVITSTIGFLSNSFETESKIGWNPDNPTGPKPGSTTTYNLAFMSGNTGSSGGEFPYIEAGGTLIKRTSEVVLWNSPDLPPRAGSYTANNWFALAWAYFYSPPGRILYPITNYGVTPPPDTPYKRFVQTLTIEKIQ